VCRLLPPAIPFSVPPLEKTDTQKWLSRGGKVPKIASYLSLLSVSFGELAGLVHDNFTLPWVWLNRFARVRCKQVFILLLLIGSSLSLR
jgi:hypothetical protein